MSSDLFNNNNIEIAGRIYKNPTTHNMLALDELRYYDKFSKTSVMNPYDALIGYKEYIFFTKPDLQIFQYKDGREGLMSHIKTNGMCMDIYNHHKEILYQLQHNAPDNTSANQVLKRLDNNAYMTLLSGSLTSKGSLPSLSSGEVDNAANLYGDSISYRWSSSSSDKDFDFSLEFDDTKYLECYKLFKVWDEYMRMKQSGSVGYNEMYRKYIFDKVLHDQISIFRILVDEDHESIIHYCKYTGVYPKTVSRESLSDLADGIKISVEFKCAFFEDMNPQILDDINEIFYYRCGYSGNINSIGGIDNIKPSINGSPGYDPMYEGGTLNLKWVSMPFIQKVDTSSALKYKLRWWNN